MAGHEKRPLVIWPRPDPAMVEWGLQLIANCTAERYEVNKGRMVRLAEYSRNALRELRATTGIAYDERARGTLQLFRTQKQVEFDRSRSGGARSLRRGV